MSSAVRTLLGSKAFVVALAPSNNFVRTHPLTLIRLSNPVPDRLHFATDASDTTSPSARATAAYAKMAASSLDSAVLKTLEANARQAEAAAESLRAQLDALLRHAQSGTTVSVGGESEEARGLAAENDRLRKEIAELKVLLEQAEQRNAGKAPAAAKSEAPKKGAEPKKAEKAADAPKKAEKAADAPKKEAKEAKPEADEPEPSVSRLDFRIGRIVKAERHPDADTLYVEEVDLGEGKPRTVVSGLVKHIPIEQMQNRLAILLCNLKPAKMRGVESQAMVMCANNGDKVEILDPPAGCVPGDRVVFDGHEGQPDAQLNPKKKIFETIQPHLVTDANRVATYKGIPFTVRGKGVCTAPSIAKGGIK